MFGIQFFRLSGLVLFSTVASMVPAMEADEYGQPVREVDVPAKSPLQGYCPASLEFSSDLTEDCILYTPHVTGLKNIPEGTRLVIEYISGACSAPLQRDFTRVNLYTLNGGISPTILPLTLQSTINGHSAIRAFITSARSCSSTNDPKRNGADPCAEGSRSRCEAKLRDLLSRPPCEDQRVGL